MILDEIVQSKKEELEHTKFYTPIEAVKDRIALAKPTRDFSASLLPGDKPEKIIRIIAEVKKASPSKGVIREDFYPVDIAMTYQYNGAAAVSVLTEKKYFKGELEFLVATRRNLKIPVLRKDFIFDDYQVYESRGAGADAILLIVSILGKDRLREMIGLAESLTMQCLVEVHDEEELKIALDAGAKMIGINNRDLKTFKTDLSVTRRLAPMIPDDRFVVSESGINTFDDIMELREYGVHAFLIGEAIMREENIAKKLKQLRGLKV